MRLLLCLLLLPSSIFAEIRLRVGEKDSVFREAEVVCQLHGRFLIRNLKLAFYNEGSRVAEGDLTCPLELGEEIVSFAMDVNGVRRKGVVVPKKRGRIAYETIVARGVDPGLIEVNEVTNEFRTRVFPIPAKGMKTVWITTVQTVEGGEVKVWPRGLGQPAKWSLSLALAGGEGEDFPKNQSGDAESVPVSSLVWKPTPDLAYRSDHGDLSFVKKAPASTEIAPEVGERLSELLNLYQEAQLTLRVFREEVGEGQEFVLSDGLSPELLRAISGVSRIGMARPRSLPWKTVRADAVIFITDGSFASGRAGIGKTPCPLHVIDSGKGTSSWLRNLALKSGGAWHSLAGLDPAMGLKMAEAVILGEVMDQWILVKAGKEGLQTPIGNWLWARLKSQEMNDQGVRREEIDDFNYRHGVMDSSSSMIVMETARQYQEFKIEPPKEDEELYQEWLSLKKSEGEMKEKRFDELAKAWKERCEVLMAPAPSLEERIKRDVKMRLDQLRMLEKSSDKVDWRNLVPFMNEFLAIDQLCHEGITEEEISSVQQHLRKLTTLEADLKIKVPWVEVIVGGQVKRVGAVVLPFGASLSDAVQAAGGATPFGATNRMKLYRNGKVYTYDLRLIAHQKVRIYSDDIIEVPGKNWLGDGGGGGRKVASFSKEIAAQIIFEAGDMNLSEYYLKALAKAVNDDSLWQSQYRVYRSACGWRADFYLNVIELLREKNAVQKAQEVTGDLVEHMPENPEILRRAAMAYRRIGALDLSHELFLRVAELLPKDAISLYHLARSEELRGNAKIAVRHYLKALEIQDTRFTEGRSIVILEELNALLAREDLKGEDFGMDPRLIRHVLVDLRVVLEWDAKQSNVDLLTQQLSGGWLSPILGVQDLTGAWWSGDVSQGYGPESVSIQGLFPGGYSFGARFYGDWNDEGGSTVTAEVRVIRNFGTAEETQETRALRIAEKTHAEILKAQVVLPGWE